LVVLKVEPKVGMKVDSKVNPWVETLVKTLVAKKALLVEMTSAVWLDSTMEIH